MSNGYSRSPRLFKGALIELTEPFLGPVPNVIVFQYNPESFTRTMNPWQPPAQGAQAETDGGGARAQPFDPGENFSLDLILDATDALETPETHPVAVVSGIADRIAAFEMLLYPTGDSLLGEGIAKIFGKEFAPRGTVPVVLFVWGPGRILPVRLTTFSVDEQAFSPMLYPIRAKVSLGLQVLTGESFGVGKNGANGKKKLSASEQLAVMAYKFTRGQKEALARANLVNSVESVLGQVPGVSEIGNLLGL